MPENDIAARLSELLRPQLGRFMVEQTPLCRAIADVLVQYGNERKSFADLYTEVEQTLFDMLYDTLGERMTVRLDNGLETRIWLSMLPEIADSALGALFELLSVYSANYHLLIEYALSAASLSAMRVIYQKYDRFLTPEENTKIRRILAERYPGEHNWLAE